MTFVVRVRHLFPIVVLLVLAILWLFPMIAHAASVQYADQVPKTEHSEIYPSSTGTLTGGKVAVNTDLWMISKAVASLEYGYEYFRAYGNGSYTTSGTHPAHANSRSMCWWWVPNQGVSGTLDLSCWRYTP